MHQHFVVLPGGVKTVEIVGASFYASSNIIFGKENDDYVKREIAWYDSQSRNVNDIEGKVPSIWKQVATSSGEINSNYGWMVYSPYNFNQFASVVETLKKDPSSRRAVMIYTRPSIQVDYNRDGMSDFICTNAVHYLIRDNRLETVVQMRSNDAVYGYKNDVMWQKEVTKRLLKELNMPGLTIGKMIWQVSSLHVYERHFNLLEEYVDEHSPKIYD